MTDDKRAYEIRNLLWEHAHPTLRGIDRERIAKLTGQIMRIATDRRLWTKWSGARETLAERAAGIWIPLRLNRKRHRMLRRSNVFQWQWRNGLQGLDREFLRTSLAIEIPGSRPTRNLAPATNFRNRP